MIIGLSVVVIVAMVIVPRVSLRLLSLSTMRKAAPERTSSTLPAEKSTLGPMAVGSAVVMAPPITRSRGPRA